MKTGIKEQTQNQLEIQAMTLLYKVTYDELWERLDPVAQKGIIEEPLGRRAKTFAHDVAKRAEIKRYNELNEGREG